MVDAIEKYRNAPGTRAVRERLNNLYSHDPAVESSLRDMDTEKLVKVLASRPNLIPMSEWTSSPEMYDLYKETRQQLGLPTNEGRIQTQAVLPEGARTPVEANYPNKAPSLFKPTPRTYNPIEPKYPGNQPIYGSLHDFREPSPQDAAAPTPPKDAGLPPATGGQNIGDLAARAGEIAGDQKNDSMFGLNVGDKANQLGNYVGDKTSQVGSAIRDGYNNLPKTVLPPDAYAASASSAYPFPVSSNAPSPKNSGVLAFQMAKANASGSNRGESKPEKSKPLQRFDQLTQPDPNLPAFDYNNQKRQRAEEEQQIIKDIQKGFVTGKFGHPSQQISEIYPTIANSEDKYKYNAQQQKEVNDQRAEARRYIQAFGSPQIQKYLIDHPDLLLQAQSDPVGTIKTIIKIEENKQTAGANPEMLGGVVSLSTLLDGSVSANKSSTPVAAVSNVARPSMEENVPAPVAPRPSMEENATAPASGVSLEDELASLRKTATAAPKVSAQVDSANSAPYRGPMTARDPLTRKEYAPIDQKDNNSGMFSRLFNNKDEQNRLANYQSDSSLRRSGPMGEETATDFVMNQPIYKKRMEDQPPTEARGGPISHGGNPHDDKCHVGIIHMAVGGRTDHLPMNVYANSYVIPADVVSGLGEGNTLAGGKVIDHMFSGDSLRKMVNKTVKSPLKRALGGDATSDYDAFRKAALPGITMPKNIDFPGIDLSGGMFGSKMTPIHGSSTNFGPTPYQYRWTPDQKSQVKAAHGGMINDRQMHPVEIIAAGGEYVIPPEVVRALGHGDAESGHKWLDNFVKSTRAHTIKTMQNLPGPKKD